MDISANKYLKSNAVYSILRVGLSSISTLLVTPFVIAKIGLEQYGYISITYFFIAFSNLLDFGLSKSLVFLLNTKQVTKEHKDQIISGVLYINIGVILLLSGVFVCLCLFEIPLLGSTISLSNSYYKALVMSSILVLFLTLYNLFQSALLESCFMLNKVNEGLMLKVLILNLLYLFNALSINNIMLYIISSIISLSLVTCYYQFYIYKNLNINLCTVDKYNLKLICRTTYGYAKVGIMTSLNSALPRLLLIYVGNSLAYISLFDVISKVTMAMLNLLSTVYRPLYALVRVNAEKIKKNMTKILIVNTAFVFSFLFALILFSDYLIDYLLPDTEYDILFLRLLFLLFGLYGSLLTYSQPLSMYFLGLGRNDIISKSLIFNTISFLVSFSILNFFTNCNILYDIGISSVILAIIYDFVLYFNYRRLAWN